MDISLGSVIFIAVKPIIKIYLILAVGFIFVKTNMLTTETSRGISGMVVNALSPALTFNKIVTNLSGSHIKEIGVFVLSGVIIFGTGFALAVVASFVTPVPHKWKWGMLFAGIFSNISDLPIAYVQSMDTGLVFTEEEGDKAVALTCILSAVQTFLMMNCGMFQIVGLDFKEKVKDDEGDDGKGEPTDEKNDDSNTTSPASFKNEKGETSNAENGESNSASPRSSTASSPEGLSRLAHQTTPFSHRSQESDLVDNEVVETDAEEEYDEEGEDEDYGIVPLTTQSTNARENAASLNDNFGPIDNRLSRPEPAAMRRRRASSISYRSKRRPSGSSFSRARSNDSGHSTGSRRSRTQTIQNIIEEYSEADRIKTIPTMDILARNISRTQEVGLNLESDDDEVSLHDSKHLKWDSFIKKHKLGWLEFMLLNMIRAPSLILLVAFFVAMIPWVRALFVKNSIDISSAPDDLPPLNFVMDFTIYIGNAAVPMGLFLLGGTLARLKIESIPKGFWKVVLFMVACRLVIMPIIGVLYTNRLHDARWITDTVARFLLIVSWSLPSATSQVYFTAFYTPLDGPHEQMDCYAVFLLAQYPLLVITLPFVVTYTLKVNLGM
ncbi:CYFA0S05e02058g1_1 [Cyberlindnera fabianii]|uniref:CYFA0S05e02058g1_1 n=1 Tax=Cyberlindnera fabianii TaxID=36022 RepID=A0A061ASH6_CYBFA|nr:CYFA0S05e02058g1_1 [Cyberlindnera fabianii]